MLNNFSKANRWLDICRASAILLVLLSHGRRLLFPIFPDAQFLKFGGFLGVEIFFVLSGFLIGSILIDKSTSSESHWCWIPHFWGRRFLRTYPNYFLFLFLNWLVIDTWRPESMPDLWHYMTFTQSLLVAHPSFFGEAWSLVIEEIFYFIVPIIMYIVWRTSAIQALLNTLFICLASSLIMRIALVYSEPDLTFNQVRSTALLRLDSIMIGVLTSYCYYHCKLWRDILIKVAPGLSLLMIPVIYIAMQPDEFMDESFILKVFLFPVANIAAAGLLVIGIGWNVSDLAYNLVRPVARWSYSAYLINLLVLSMMNFYLPAVTAGTALVYWTGFLLITLTFSGIVYNFFERKVLLLRDNWIK
ncbi:acyltransferase [Aeromonas dhakensis]|uniref:acyltransferase family protein n=1 Tax=Aeromonas dhakensis TaxID=196024 RepID=UPI00227B3A40|nr:acyltransferase [Aeromonas dhakensis]WAG09819.1 acyltransferase [Aeromonas dhakensis]WDF93385.1 acyltransferase [Aeromonas dhakensis]